MPELTKHFLSYLMGNAFIQSINFLVLPVIGRHFTPAEYAVIPIVEIYLMIFCWLTSVMLVSGMNRFYFDDRFKRQELLNTVVTFLLVSGTAVAGLVCVILSITNMAQAYTYIIMAATIHQVLLHLYTVPFEKLKLEQRPSLFLCYNLVKSLCYLGVFWYLVAICRHGVVAVFEAQVLSSLVVLGMAWYQDTGLHKIRITVNYKILRTLLSFSGPLILAGIGMFLIEYTGRFFILRYLGDEALGHFSFIYKIVNALSVLLLVPANNVWTPYVFQTMGDESSIRKSMGLAVTLMTAAAMAIILGLLSNYELIIDILSKGNFKVPEYVFFLLGAGYLLYSLLAILSPGFHIREKTFLLGRFFLCTGMVNLALNIVLIPEYGLLGAAGAIFGSFLILFILYAINLQKIFPIRYEWTKLGILWIAFLLAAAIIIVGDWRIAENNMVYACFLLVAIISVRGGGLRSILISRLHYFFKAYCLYTLYRDKPIDELPSTGFSFKVLDAGDITEFHRFASLRTPGYFERVVPQLFDQRCFRGLALIDVQTKEIVYVCWIRLQSFYASDLRKQITLDRDEAYFFDDYTLPRYRSLGLHGAMMVRRVNYCIRAGYTRFYIAIQLFHDHPERAAHKIGFRRDKLLIGYRQGSATAAFTKIIKKVSAYHFARNEKIEEL